MNTKTIVVETDASGDFTYERRLAGVVKGIAVDVGDLSTPDIDITDGVWTTSILSVNGVAADTIYQPVVAAVGTDGVAITGQYVSPAIFGSLKIVVAGGGASKTGTIRLLFA